MKDERGELCSWFLVLGSLFLVLCSWFLVSSSWFLIPCSWLRKPGDGGEHTRPRVYRPVPPPGDLAKAIFHHGYVCYRTASCFEGFNWLPAPGGTPAGTGGTRCSPHPPQRTQAKGNPSHNSFKLRETSGRLALVRMPSADKVRCSR